MSRHLLAAAVVAGLAATAAAQTPGPAAGAGAAAAPAPAANLPVPPADFTYASESRRDPFVSLVREKAAVTNDPVDAPRVDGPPGLRTEDVVVRGILESRDGMVAIVAAPSGKTYIVRAGDRLADGTIRAITPQALVIMQVVNDPLSVDKQREVRKPLRVQEEGR